MTLRDWLKLHRQPSYLGINARLWLQQAGGQHWHHRPLAPMMFHLAINMQSVVKHDLCRTYLPLKR